MLLNVALERQFALGRITCEVALGRRRKLSNLRKIREILQKIEGISENFAVKKKRFGRQ